MSQGWEDRAEGWIAWARKPSHDAYAFFRDAMFELLPPPQGRALEIGCGEGRVCRDLRELGYDAVEEHGYEFHAARDGLEFTFATRTYPLRSYAAALEPAGLLIEAMREPEGRDAHDRFVPEFLMLRALKP